MNLEVVIGNATKRFTARPALADGERTVTFQRVDERTRRLGSGLASLGLGGGEPVASLQYI